MLNNKDLEKKQLELPNKEYFTNLGVEYDNYSVLALSVYFANANYLVNTNNDSTLLEVGCGSDSAIHDKFKGSWFGIDVVKEDRHGKPTLASDMASVHDMPYENEFFDNVLSNQSIEHWHEYGINFKMALSEVNRVLKLGGKFTFNFPVHLHGHKYFVLNNLDAVHKELKSTGFEIQEIREYTSKELQPYLGWLKCGFPTLYLKLFSKNFKKTSAVLEYDVVKTENSSINHEKNKPLIKKSRIQKRMHHGFLVLFFNILNRIKL